MKILGKYPKNLEAYEGPSKTFFKKSGSIERGLKKVLNIMMTLDVA